MKTKLSSRNLLNELERPEYSALLAEFTVKRFPKNTLVFAPGHPEDLVFIVKKGRVRVYLAFEDKDFSLAILEKGDIYSTHTSAYVTTLEEAELMLVPTSVFRRLMASHPLFFKTTIGILGEMLQQSFSIINSLVFKDVTQRLVEFLLHEARTNGRQSPKGITINLNLTVEQIAAVIGSSRQTVSSILNQMLKAGVLVKSRRQTYLIPNLEILKEFPHL